jgi:hypothetical protein
MNLIGRIHGNNLRTIAVLLLATLGVLPALLMWRWVSTNWVPIPMWDEWYTPGSQFASWCRGTLTISELFSQHNESRKFFPRLLYFALAAVGGWDVRKEMGLLFILVCALCVLLFFLLRRTPGATLVSTFLGWALLVSVCFAPVQVENFLYGIEGEAFFPGIAVVAAAALNLSCASFRTKTLGNLSLSFVANYTFANGMLLWALAWPLPAPNEPNPRRHRILWSTLYGIAGAISVGCYFIGYHRPSYHPKLASVSASFWELMHYLVLWVGRYFASDFGDPLILGIIALIPFAGAVGFVFEAIRRRGDWRTFYSWLLIGAYACATGAITAVGRLGFGVQQALDTRYVAFSLFFYIALVGLYFAIYCSRVRSGSPALRASFLTNAAWAIALFALLWAASYKKNLGVLAQNHKYRVHLLHTLEWLGQIPDNPDLELIFPYVGALKDWVTLLQKHRILRLPFVHGSLASAVQQPPPPSDGSHGQIEACDLDPDGTMHVTGWAWLPERNRRADCVIIGSEDRAGVFKPITVLETAVARRDLYMAQHNPYIFRAGFAGAVKAAKLPDGALRLKGWAIDLRAQKAWPLASSLPLEGIESSQRRLKRGATTRSRNVRSPVARSAASSVTPITCNFA